VHHLTNITKHEGGTGGSTVTRCLPMSPPSFERRLMLSCDWRRKTKLQTQLHANADMHHASEPLLKAACIASRMSRSAKAVLGGEHRHASCKRTSIARHFASSRFHHTRTMQKMRRRNFETIGQTRTCRTDGTQNFGVGRRAAVSQCRQKCQLQQTVTVPDFL
jgi:hypothetical protein